MLELNASSRMQGSRGFVRPIPLSDEKFAEIVELTKQTRPRDNCGHGNSFDVGDVLEVLDGPFKGLKGPVLISANEDKKVVTLALCVMGQDTPVEIPIRDVVKCWDGVLT